MAKLPAMRRTAILVAALLAAIGPAAAPAVTSVTAHADPAIPHGEWVAGDLHVHTVYGHDTCVSPTDRWPQDNPDPDARTGSCDEPWTWAFFPAQRFDDAVARGMDFTAITDHNNVVNQYEPGEIAWLEAHPGFIYLPAYENSQPGHVQMLGARWCYGNDGVLVGQKVNCNALVADKSAAGEQRLADGLRADGGVFQVNHPSDMHWISSYGHAVVPDSVEVWNTGPWAFQPPAPASNDNELSLDWYDGFLRAGHEVAATGGSDSHWRLVDGFAGIGQPTTWVWVTERTAEGVLEGIREHRTFVSAQPPALHGPKLFLEADRHGDGSFSAMVGDEVPPGSTYRVRTVDAPPGAMLRVVTDQGSTDLVTTGTTTTFTPGSGGVPAAATFVRVELFPADGQQERTTVCNPVAGTTTTLCRDRWAVLALTSPIYVRD